jgi:hypothetical protein
MDWTLTNFYISYCKCVVLLLEARMGRHGYVAYNSGSGFEAFFRVYYVMPSTRREE